LLGMNDAVGAFPSRLPTIQPQQSHQLVDWT
jgi:hypothetical protein